MVWQSMALGKMTIVHALTRASFPRAFYEVTNQGTPLDRSPCLQIGPTGRKGKLVPALYSFDTISQHYGDFFAGFQWDISGCGTFRHNISAAEASKRMKNYMRQLGQSIKAWIPYVAVPEQRFSGLGMPAIAVHFHFLAACPRQWRSTFATRAEQLWEDMEGNARVTNYDPAQAAAYYLAKTAGKADFEFMLENIDRLPYQGPADLLTASASSSYVPKHAVGHIRLKTLVVRDVTTGLPK